jgi:hypothetical protein
MLRTIWKRARERERERERCLIFFFQYNLFLQGDEEKLRGIQPQSLMDRSLADELPKNQVKILIL